MPLYQPTELKKRLDRLGTKAKKGLSQNFLIDGNIIRNILAVADVQKGDLIYEIGPGPGAMTEALLEKGAHVIAIEKDSLFAEALSDLQTTDKRLTIVCADVLTYPFPKHLEKKAKVIANLPYHITSPILGILAPLTETFSSLTLMVQKEVADRMAATVGSKNFSSLTLFLQYYARIKNCFTVSANCFSPRPKVASAVVQLHLQPPVQAIDEERFFHFVRQAFQQRRKMLRTSLKETYGAEQIESAFKQVGIPLQARPETIPLDRFIALFILLQASASSKSLG